MNFNRKLISANQVITDLIIGYVNAKIKMKKANTIINPTGPFIPLLSILLLIFIHL